MKSLLYVFLFLPGFLFGQYFEAGIMVGASNYVGDLSSNSSAIYLNETGFAGGAFTRFNINDFAALRLSFSTASISGTDANADFESIRERNLNFQTGVLEAGLIGEFNVIGFQPYNLSRPFSPYLFGGISLIYFNPKTDYQGQIVDLQPLGTEGQGLEGQEAPYDLLSLAIPFGVGVKYAINDSWNVGLELGARATFTDYLDDVSTTYMEYNKLLAGNGELAAALGNRQGEYLDTEPVIVPTGTPRGDDLDSDWFFILGVSISYNFLDNGLVGSRGRSKRRSGCKTD